MKIVFFGDAFVKFEKNVIVGKSITLQQLKDDGFDAIFISSGAGFPKMMNIKGENLEVVKLDTYQGNVTIKGRINLVSYIDENTKKESSMFTKLFK